jgi:hypothetical protein
VSAESRYGFLLRAYPRGLRDERGDEMLDVLLAVEERRGRWSALPEAVALVRHGLAARLRQYSGARVPSYVGVAGVALAVLLAVLGTAQLSQMGLRGLGLDGYPREWGTWAVWVDPRWPVQLAWVATAAALLVRACRVAVLLAWAAVLLHGWMVVAGLAHLVTASSVWWVGDVGPGWLLSVNATQVGWFALSVATALLLGGPARARSGVEALPVRRWSQVLLAGLAGAVVAGAAGSLAHRLSGGMDTWADRPASALVPVLLAAAVLAVLLRRSPQGRAALALLAVAGLAPLLARWSDPASVLLAAGPLVAVGYVIGARRARRTT